MSRFIREAQFPPPGYLVGTITVNDWWSMFDMLVPQHNTFASTTWPAANRGYFVPFELPSPRYVTQIAWVNGGTASGNVDAGIYDLSGNRLASGGGTAQTGTNAIQAVDITDLYLDPGVYYMALSMDGTAGTITRNTAPNNTIQTTTHGLRQVATVYPLPSTVTLANPTTVLVPFMGVTFHATF